MTDETDEQLFAKARAHMEKYSAAASLDRRLWDATVRIALRSAASETRLSDRCEKCPFPKDGCIFPRCGEVPREALEKAVIKAALDLFGATSSAAFKLPVPNTTPPLFVTCGEGTTLSATPCSQWIAVGERVPGNYSTVLIVDGDGIRSTGYWTGKRWYVDVQHQSDPQITPTHWMPLPEAP